MDSVAMWCGYGVMIVASVAIVLFGSYAVAVSLNEVFAEIVKTARQTYWWSRWVRFHSIARARKERKE